MAFKVIVGALALALGGCAAATATPKESLENIPANWIDLPEAPFVARTVGRKAILVNRSTSDYDSVTAGCVQPENGKVKVLWSQSGPVRW